MIPQQQVEALLFSDLSTVSSLQVAKVLQDTAGPYKDTFSEREREREIEKWIVRERDE